MNRLLKILLPLIIIQKPKIEEKVRSVFENEIGTDRLLRPNLGCQDWGQKIEILEFTS